MGIFRGIGGTGNSTDDGVVDAVTEQAVLATNKATEAANSASSASASATSASNSATSASTSATTATTKASEASNSATSAATSATSAATSATSASASATTATTKASEAATSATNAATSETNAATSATTATTKASEAATSATTATTKAGEASTSATNAASSATSASTSASTATTKASEASTSAASAASSYDDFDDRYLGAKSSAPSADNDGDSLVTGALYFDTSSNAMKVWSGSSWLDAYASLSGALIATNNLSDLNNAGTARTNLGLGTAATTASTDYATAAQGTTADNALPKSGGAMTGAITTNSTFDGRDVSADGAKLDGIEASADVTDTANVTAAGALMDSEVTNLAQVKAFSSSDYATAAQGTKADTAHGWGNHATAGYLTSFDITTQTDPKYLRSDTADSASGELTFSNGLKITGGAGTIAGATFGNGWFQLGTSSQGLTIDTNEMYTAGDGDFNFGALGSGKWKFTTRPRFTTGIDFGDSSPVVDENNNYLRITTSYGYTDIGSGNSTYSHFQTDRGQFYFNKQLTVDTGIFASFNEDLKLRRANNSSYQMTLSTSGATFTHNVTAYSDGRLKEDVKPIENALDTVQKLEGVTYTRKDNQEKNIGFIAQQIEEACPELAERVVGEMDDERKTKHVNYANMVALLVEAVKELKAEVDELKAAQ